MDWQGFTTVFLAIFVAEIGDKTQLATLLFAAEGQKSPWLVFAASGLALLLAAAIGVVAGGALSRTLDPQWLKRIAGVGFIAVGIWTLLK